MQAQPSGADFFEGVEVRSTFATPVSIGRVRNAQAINRELKPLILERERAAQSRRISNQGGWQSNDDFTEWCGPAGQQVLAAARLLADRLTKHRSGGPVKVDWKTVAWANVNRRDHSNVFHAHPGNFWSGTYYVDDGGIARNPALGGEFEIQDPRGIVPAMYNPSLAVDVREGTAMGANLKLRPESGMMFLFPSWLMHAVAAYRGEGVRISVAFNLAV